MKYGFITVATPAAGNVVTLAEAGDQVSAFQTSESPISYGDEDDRLNHAIAAAEDFIESICWFTLLDAVFEWRIDRLPTGSKPVTLPKNPVSSVTSVAVTKSDGTIESVTPRVIKSKHQTIILPPANETWPASRGDEGDVVVTFNAGFADAASVPKALKQAVLLSIGTFYEHRESEIVGTITNELKAARALAWSQRNLYR